MDSCLLCNTLAVTTRQDNSSRTIYSCSKCGVYVVSDLVEDVLQKHRSEVCSFLRHRALAKKSETLLISYDKAHLDKGYLQMTVEQIVELFPKNFTEQMEQSLLNLALLSKFPGDEVKVESLDVAPEFYLKKHKFEALSFLIRAMMMAELVEVNYYGTSFFPCGVVVSPKGWDYLANLSRQKEGTRPAAFLIHNASNENTSWDVKHAAAAAAKECDVRLLSREAMSHEGVIGLELAAKIKASSFLLADLSDPLPETYCAIGYAVALRKPFLLTCHENNIGQLEMDFSPKKVVAWNSPKQLQLEWVNFIRAVD